jgi:ribosomal subunit interface protein
VEVVLKGRGYRVSDEVRDLADHKLAKLSRLEPRTSRIQVEIISEKNPRLDGAKRVEASLDIPKRTFRAHAEHHEVGSAIDEIVEKLERQVRDHHGKIRTNQKHGADRLKSSQRSGAPVEQDE